MKNPEMISLDAALAAYRQTLPILPTEIVAVADCDGRVLAADVFATIDLPRFDNSAMDGYALRAADLSRASIGEPVRLAITSFVAAGSGLPAALTTGAAARIMTGAPIPAGADSVIPQERVERDNDALVFVAAYPAGRNIRSRGSELCKGTRLAVAGQRVTPGLLASLANAGIAQLAVYRHPRIRVLVTGDELRPAGTELSAGHIIDSNGPMIRAVLARWGCLPLSVTQVGDTLDAVRTALADALGDADLVITSGGASVGDRDYLLPAAAALGLRQVFWKVAQKPGKPMYFGVREAADSHVTAALLALPGNPGAVLAGLTVHARCLLNRLEGLADAKPHWAVARLSAAIEPDSQRELLLRMRLRVSDDGGLWLDALPHQDSHMLSNLADSGVLARIPCAAEPFPAGSLMSWVLLP